MKSLRYTNFILTAIACLLAWIIVSRSPGGAVHAQDVSGPYRLHGIADPSVVVGGVAEVNRQLNDAVGTADIVAIFPNHSNGYVVVTRGK